YAICTGTYYHSSIASSIFSQGAPHHRDLHSFPTRRSSDLVRGRNAGKSEVPKMHSYMALPPSILSFRIEMEGRIRRNTMSSSLLDRKSTRLNSSHRTISYAVFCLKKKNSSPRSLSHSKPA